MNFYKGKGGKGPATEVKLENLILQSELLSSQNNPENYVLVGSNDIVGADDDGIRAVRAVNTALTLRIPLLVSGEPGSGKTQLGYSVAHELGKSKPLIFSTKSTSKSKDLFYTYDAVSHLQSANQKSYVPITQYITYTALGLAILLALPLHARNRFLADPKTGDLNYSQYSDQITKKLSSNKQIQSVVVIDEIDKAPRDFPNDLLNEIQNFKFQVSELFAEYTDEIKDEFKPIILITTNEERNLPNAFLRRCAFLYLNCPTGLRLQSILNSRLGLLIDTKSPFVQDAQQFYESLRKSSQVDKPPSTSEFLQFLRVLTELQVDPQKSFFSQREKVMNALGLLVKNENDFSLAENLLLNYR